jgi:hypothetical protein
VCFCISFSCELTLSGLRDHLFSPYRPIGCMGDLPAIQRASLCPSQQSLTGNIKEC